MAELFAGTVDSIASQIRADNRLLSKSINCVFVTIPNDRDRFNSLFVTTFGLPQGTKPNKEFKKIFAMLPPTWHRESERISIPDTLVQYQLLLSETKLEQLKGQLETLCAMEVDVKSSPKPYRGNASYLQETDHLFDKGFTTRQSYMDSTTDTVYVSTNKIHRHLYNFYISGLKTCSRSCSPKTCGLERMILVEAHRQFYGVSANYSKEIFPANREYFYIDSKILL